MSATEVRSSDLLGAQASALVYAIDDPRERERVMSAVRACDDALRVVDGLDLSQYEMMHESTADLGVWESLAPHVRNLLTAVRTASDRLTQLYPAEEAQKSISLDIDAAFDFSNTGALPPPIRDNREQEVDEIVSTGRTADLVGASIASLAGMLQHDVVQFGQRLRSPRVMTDRWFLLGELQELRAKCTQCLEAVVATVLSAYTTSDIQVLLPRYATSTKRAILIRTMIVDASYDVNRLNLMVATAKSDQALSIRHALIARLDEVGVHPGYRFLRPLDKRALIDFRQHLKSYDDLHGSLLAFRRTVEGLSKFLEVMRAINQREVLVANDRRKFQTIRMMLESEAEGDEVQPLLESVYGRWPSLDDFIRLGRRGRFAPCEDVLLVVDEAQESLRE